MTQSLGMFDSDGYLKLEILNVALDQIKSRLNYNLSLAQLFPDKGFALSSDNSIYRLYSAKRGAIRELFGSFNFTNKVVPLVSLYEKEYLTLTKAEYEEVLNFIKNAKIIT